MNDYFLLFFSITLASIAQITLKLSTTYTNFLFLGISVNKFLFLSAALMVISLYFYTLSLRSIPLKIAYPSVSIGYFFTILLSYLYFGTKLYIKDFLGLSLILIGVYLLALKKI